MSRIIVTGAASGLGECIADTLLDCGHEVESSADKKFGMDLRIPLDITEYCRHIQNEGPVDVLINCAGVNRISWIKDLALETYQEIQDVNTRAPFLMTQALLPALIESKGTVLNIISNAALQPMTCSLAYNASKGALHIMTLQMARELTRKYGITVFGISPNKMKGTEISESIDAAVPEMRGWTPEEAAQYAKASSLTGLETEVESVAEFIAYLLEKKNNHIYLSGCIIPYGA